MDITNVVTPTVRDELPSAEALRQSMHGLLSGLSHDLRTPLSTINGWLFVLDSDKLDAAARKRALAKMRANIEDQVRLIDDVLLLSCGMSGHLSVDAKLISPSILLETAIENLRATALAGAVSLPPAIVSDMRKISADGDLLRRVFEILLFHALKTTPAGGRLETAVAGRHDHLEITVCDNGKGLSSTELASLFDAFRNTEGAPGSAYPGAERNLMLARMLVEKQGGQLHAASGGPGLGTTFTMRMPCDAEPISVAVATNESAV